MVVGFTITYANVQAKIVRASDNVIISTTHGTFQQGNVVFLFYGV
jgi:hypothetical protein